MFPLTIEPNKLDWENAVEAHSMSGALNEQDLSFIHAVSTTAGPEGGTPEKDNPIDGPGSIDTECKAISDFYFQNSIHPYTNLSRTAIREEVSRLHTASSQSTLIRCTSYFKYYLLFFFVVLTLSFLLSYTVHWSFAFGAGTFSIASLLAFDQFVNTSVVRQFFYWIGSSGITAIIIGYDFLPETMKTAGTLIGVIIGLFAMMQAAMTSKKD